MGDTGRENRNQRNPISARFKIEEYRQIMIERRFVMTRYMQAVGFYLVLSAFVLRQLMSIDRLRTAWLLVCVFTGLNVLGMFAAGRFKSMAKHALDRERAFTKMYSLDQFPELFWGYWAGIALLMIMEGAAIMLAMRGTEQVS
jgi:uncharacterized membrane protein